MQHVKVALPLMQEIVNVLSRLPYATVGGLMPQIHVLKVEADAPLPPREEAAKTDVGPNMPPDAATE